MRFIYLDSGAIYCWWGKTLQVPITPLGAVISILKGEKVIDAKNEWFLVFDPKAQ